MDYIRHVSIDVDAQENMLFIYAKQGDVETRFLNVVLTRNGQAYRAPETAFAMLRCHKPDGHATLNAGELQSDGSFTFPLSQQTLAVVGKVFSDISVSDGNTIISTATFTIVVLPSPDIADQTVSTDEFEALNKAIAHIRSATIKVGNVEAGEDASVTNVGTDTDAIFDFILPRGLRGRGIESISLTSGNHAPGTLDTYTIEYEGGGTSTFQVYNGANGDPNDFTTTVPIEKGGTNATTATAALANLRGLSQYTVSRNSAAYDLDTVMDGVMYINNGTTNWAPLGAVLGGSGAVVVQIQYPYSGNSDERLQLAFSNNQQTMAVRQKVSGSWSDWRPVYTGANLTYGSSQPTARTGAIWLKPIE